MEKHLKLLQNNPKKFVEIFENKYGGKIIYISETGSVLHGTNSENSDKDYKGIYIPSLDNLILGTSIKSFEFKTSDENLKNTPDDIDFDLFSIFEFINQVKIMESNNTELLFSMFANHIVYQTKEVNLIKDNYKYLISSNIRQFTGFAMSMAYRYSDKGERLREVEELKFFFEKYMKGLSKNQKKKITINEMEGLEEFISTKKYLNFIDFLGSNKTMAVYLEILNSKFILSNKIGYVYNGIIGILNSFGSRAEKAKDDNGIDRKAFAHALRAILQAKEILENGVLVYPLIYADRIKKLKYDESLTRLELTNIIEEEFQSLLELKTSIQFFNEDKFSDKLKIDIYKMFLK